MSTTYYSRSLDADNCRQNLVVVDGIVTAQYLAARQGCYTGDGSPDYVGQAITALRGRGFRKVRGPQFFSDAGRWQSGRAEARLENW